MIHVLIIFLVTSDIGIAESWKSFVTSRFEKTMYKFFSSYFHVMKQIVILEKHKI